MAPSTCSCLALMYHEVLPGVPPKGADIYKLGEADFRAHIAAIREAIGAKPVGRVDAPDAWREPRPVFLTFDDGEQSAYTIVADLLESHGWRGHFFIVTDLTGGPGYLSAAQIRELDRRGHVIGSHTCSHPVPISICPPEEIARQWRESVKLLEDVVGHAVPAASVPGGYFSRRVADAAIGAGIRYLFNSEPRASTWRLGECLVLGRYALRRGMGPQTAAGFASGRILPRWRQAALWNAKKLLKRANVRAYERARQAILGA
ncbi:MAG: polysaccharide deacetylase family protein [Acidobacteriota bacterium]